MSKKLRSFKDFVINAIGEDIEIAFVPDDYKIDKENKIITLYEKVKYNDLSECKIKKLGNFWFDCDCEDWEVELYMNYWYGAKSKVDLEDVYYKYCYEGELKCTKSQ